MNHATRTLRSGFLRSSETYPDRPALQVQGEILTFRELREKAVSLAATLYRRAPSGEPPLTAVFAYRSVTAFTGVLGALLRGHGYVPLNPSFPPSRTRTMLERAGCRTIIVGAEAETQLDQVLAGVEAPLLLILPDQKMGNALAKRWPLHTVLVTKDLESPESWEPGFVSPDAIAYLLFTSGSTGMPKGVQVAHRNVRSFLDYMVERYAICETDRLSQTFPMSFDLSVFDMFIAWEKGACVCCPSENALIKPGKFIQQANLSIWLSVPSTAIFMKRLGELKPNQYPHLRLSLFCGEALPQDVVEHWAKAAPNAIIENLYGPTELTIACTLYRWNPETSPQACVHGLVPIGTPSPGMKALFLDDNLQEVHPGEEGELVMTGPQLSLGYLDDPEKTAAAFVTPPGKSEVYYRTGDRVRRPVDDGPIVYLGRMDNQIKIRGHRVELGEIEAVLRQTAQVDTAIAVGWPVTPSGADGIVAFIDEPPMDVGVIREQAKRHLPNYMLPSDIRIVDGFPLNASGKVDRQALLSHLKPSSRK